MFFKFNIFSHIRKALDSHGQTIKNIIQRRPAMLDRFYTPNQSKLGFHHKSYFIHEYTVGSDHFSIQLEISIGNSEVRDAAFKLNVSHLQGEISDVFSNKWAGLPAQG